VLGKFDEFGLWFHRFVLNMKEDIENKNKYYSTFHGELMKLIL
jgi:hypothetical protein